MLKDQRYVKGDDILTTKATAPLGEADKSKDLPCKSG